MRLEVFLAAHCITCNEALRLVEHLRMPPGTQHRLLDDVLRPGPVAPSEMYRIGPQCAGVLVVQRAHEVGVARPHTTPGNLT